MGHLAKNWRKSYILETRAEADRDMAFTLQPRSRKFDLKWVGKHWVQFSLANVLLIEYQSELKKSSARGSW